MKKSTKINTDSPKILFLGSAISDATVDYILANSKVKPSIAPVNFQRNLLKGMPAEQVTVLSQPPVATYPAGAYLGWGVRKELVTEGIETTYIPVINLPIFKQACGFICSFVGCLRWIRKEKAFSRVILVYGGNVFPQMAAQLAAKLCKVKVCYVVTDPIREGSLFTPKNILHKWGKQLVWYIAEKIRHGYDGYVCLTKDLITLYDATDKPHVLVEGVADPHTFDNIPAQGKENPPVIMYAGALSKGFGIPALLEAMHNLDVPCQLWLFGGGGDCKDSITEYERKDTRIKYWGKVPRYDLLCAMKKASVLVSVKPVGEEYAKYMFPSKIMEYASSGTLIAATCVAGIPQEYFDHLIPMESDTVEGVGSTLRRILSMTEEERIIRGEETKTWVESTKNSHIQAKRILELLQQLCGEEEK